MGGYFSSVKKEAGEAKDKLASVTKEGISKGEKGVHAVAEEGAQGGETLRADATGQDGGRRKKRKRRTKRHKKKSRKHKKRHRRRTHKRRRRR